MSDNLKVYQCQMCLKVFKRRQNLWEHTNKKKKTMCDTRTFK